MMVTERTHHKDVKSEKKNWKYVYPLKRYSVLKFEIFPILRYFTVEKAQYDETSSLWWTNFAIYFMAFRFIQVLFFYYTSLTFTDGHLSIQQFLFV